MNDFTSQTYDVHTTILWVCAAIAVVVFAVMIYSIATFQKASGADLRRGEPREVLGEILWAIIPIAIVVGMSVPAVRTLVLAAETPAIASANSEDTRTFQLVRGQL